MIGVGKQIPKRTYVLVFEGAPGDEDLEGFVIKVRPPTVEEVLEHVKSGVPQRGVLPAEQLDDAYAQLATRLVEWNLEDDGVPLPATLEGLHQLPQDVGGRILGSWLWETATVPRPLPHDSPTGSNSVDESLIPMGALPDPPS